MVTVSGFAVALTALLLQSQGGNSFSSGGALRVGRRGVARYLSSSTPHMVTITDADREAVAACPDFMDEKAVLAKSTFPIKPDDLIVLAKKVIMSNYGVDDPDLLAPEFCFGAPIIQQEREAFLNSLKSFDIKGILPDLNPNAFMFTVDPLQPNRVWFMSRAEGTNTEDIKFLKTKATGKKVIWPPTMNSFTFNEQGQATEVTIGYIVDRKQGNTGGLGAVFGLLYALGKPFPFREARPFKPSLGFKMFTTMGQLAQRFSKPKPVTDSDEK